jgi:hypothetical protein
MLGGWESNDLVQFITAILLHDVLGMRGIQLFHFKWDAARVYPTLAGDADGQFWRDPRTGKKHIPDIMMEMWPQRVATQRLQYIYDKKLVRAHGPLGYLGANGIYLTGANTEAHFSKSLESWKQINGHQTCGGPPNTQLFPPQSATDPLKGCNRHAPGGRYEPPQCVGNKYCRDIVGLYDSYATGQIEQLSKNLKLNFTTIYAGGKYQAYYSDCARRNVPCIVYDFDTSRNFFKFTNDCKFKCNTTKVNFPETEVNPKYTASANGSLASAIPYDTLEKLSSHQLCTDSPDVCEMLSRLTLDIGQVRSLITKLPDADTRLFVTQDDLYDASCSWLKENKKVWNSERN